MYMTTKEAGTRAMGAVMYKLMATGRTILLPIGDNERYDFVIHEGDTFLRVQCKAGHLKDGAVRFATSSTNLVKGKWTKNKYVGEADVFGVYCPDNKMVYLIPINDVGDLGHSAHLRVTPSKNGQQKGTRLASTYEV
jgi:hypothetical protein